MTKRIGVLVGAIVLACLRVVPGSASAKPLCRAGKPVGQGLRSQAVVKTAKVLVYDNQVNRNTYVCARPNGRSYVLGNGLPGGPPANFGEDNSIVVGPRVRWPYVAAVFEGNQLAYYTCGKLYTTPPDGTVIQCGEPTFAVKAVDARSGQSAHLHVQDCTPTTVPINNDPNPPVFATWHCNAIPLATSSAGAVAWIDNRGLVAAKFHPRGKRLNAHPTVLDPSAGGLVSLRRLTVNWYDIVNGTRVSHTETLN